jgi:peptide/nickel transport system substrate-binding protein/oligopeptide transport system substrate-binding protein
MIRFWVVMAMMHSMVVMAMTFWKAEQVMIDEALIVPLIHPKKVAVISDKLKGKGVEQASSGYSPLTEVDLYFYTHTSK